MSVDWQWRPLSPTEVVDQFKPAPAGWCIAGGWAIDLFIGQQTRPHADIDVLVPRGWLPDLHDLLPGWQLYAAEGTLTRWLPGEPFPDSTCDIWCLREGETWELQLMLGVQSDQEWMFRRDPRIRGPLGSHIMTTPQGVPFLAPEIQLLYKAKDPVRPKDEHDFQHALPMLSTGQRAWLDAALAVVMPAHPWRARLGRADGP